MLSKWNWIVFNLIVYVTTAPHGETLLEDEAKAFFELIELDYEDICYNIANVQWSFILSPSNKTLSIWVSILLFKLLLNNNDLFFYLNYCLIIMICFSINNKLNNKFLSCYILGDTAI